MNIGEYVGDYEVIGILGSGGMGQVYKVRNTLSERIEAMKVLLPNIEGDPGLADRFLREIKVQATLDHPNIAKLHTAMRSGNQLLMFMEFVDGVSLAKMMESHPIPPDQAAAITVQVLDALSYAHSHGVIHRDIKPANIMLLPSGVAKLMDFGIARVQADKRLTQTGGAVGTLFYMSPEQIRGAEPDPRSDIYSLGVTLYEMVTGRRPFGGDSDYQIMSAHLQQAPVPPIEIVPGIPPDLSDIIVTAMAKDAAARFQSAAAFQAALAHAFPPAGRVPPPLPPPAPRAAPMPPPPPLSAPPPIPPPPPAVTRTSNRGLYMAVGSLATLALLVAAAVEGPRFLHGGSSAAAEPAGQAPPSTSSAPAAAPAPDQAAAPAGSPNSPSSSNPTGRPAPAAPTRAQTPVENAAPAAPTPAQTAPPSPAVAQQPPQQQPAAPQAPPPAPVNRDYVQLRQQINELTIRANSASDGLRSFEQQQSRQGLGLRADIREAKTRLDYQIQEAGAALQNGDFDTARQSLRYAQSAVETIEKFLGR